MQGSTHLRDASYTGVYGKRFVSITRGLYVSVQSNKLKALEYRMIQAYQDLYLEPHEEAQFKIAVVQDTQCQ